MDLRLLMRVIFKADFLARFSAGRSIPAKIAMIAITTRSSIKVKNLPDDLDKLVFSFCMVCPFYIILRISRG